MSNVTARPYSNSVYSAGYYISRIEASARSAFQTGLYKMVTAWKNIYIKMILTIVNLCCSSLGKGWLVVACGGYAPEVAPFGGSVGIPKV